MTETARFRCTNCGERFKVEVLTRQEQEEFARRGQRGGNIRCPGCGGFNVQRD
jgi:DNA-directed RNA polymerase subunit RPC12/RpoP